MKKIVSAILLLALCIGCIAGCAPKEDANLNAAKEYLYTMYKDAKTTTDSDYTLVSQVRINDVVYPITWTTDKADNVQITAGENNMTNVTITASDEDVNYKLTATMSNEDGQEVSLSFDRIIPAKAQVGGTVVLAYPKENKYVTGGHYQYTSSSGTTKWELTISENKADAIALEVVDNGDETVSFKAGDYYLFCDATNVQFVTEQGDNTKFVLEAADTDGGYYIKCAVANYGGKAQYLEVYSGYLTCYGMGSDPSIYVFKMEEATGAAGTVSGLEGNTDTPAVTDPPATNPPADNSNGSTVSVADGTYVIVTDNKTLSSLAEDKAYGYPYATDVTVSGSTVTGYTAADVLTIKNVDGGVTIQDAYGRYFYMKGTYNSFNVDAAAPAEGHVWKFVKDGDNLKLVNVLTNKTLAYSNSYTSWGAYPELTDDHLSNLTVLAVNAENATPPAAGNNGTSEGTAAATLDMMGTTNLSSRTTTQTVYAANGITYTNDKSSSQTDNYDQQGTYAARAYKGSTIKVEYTGMTKIVFTLDDYSSGKYLEGFDGMTVSGATISRDGDKVTVTFSAATNVFQSADLASQVRIEKIEVFTN